MFRGTAVDQGGDARCRYFWVCQYSLERLDEPLGREATIEAKMDLRRQTSFNLLHTLLLSIPLPSLR